MIKKSKSKIKSKYKGNVHWIWWENITHHSSLLVAYWWIFFRWAYLITLVINWMAAKSTAKYIIYCTTPTLKKATYNYLLFLLLKYQKVLMQFSLHFLKKSHSHESFTLICQWNFQSKSLFSPLKKNKSLLYFYNMYL